MEFRSRTFGDYTQNNARGEVMDGKLNLTPFLSQIRSSREAYYETAFNIRGGGDKDSSRTQGIGDGSGCGKIKFNEMEEELPRTYKGLVFCFIFYRN